MVELTPYISKIQTSAMLWRVLEPGGVEQYTQQQMEVQLGLISTMNGKKQVYFQSMEITQEKDGRLVTTV